MYYNQNPYRLCKNTIISTAVTVVTVNGVDTLLIDIPNGPYNDGYKYCIIVAQSIPTTATINMPVAISIGGVTTTVYPLVNCDCSQVTACSIGYRNKYPVLVSTNSAGGVFKVLRRVYKCTNNNLTSLPATGGNA